MNGAWFGLMTVARYIALSLISRYHCLDPTNRDISALHCNTIRVLIGLFFGVHGSIVFYRISWYTESYYKGFLLYCFTSLLSPKFSPFGKIKKELRADLAVHIALYPLWFPGSSRSSCRNPNTWGIVGDMGSALIWRQWSHHFLV